MRIGKPHQQLYREVDDERVGTILCRCATTRSRSIPMASICEPAFGFRPGRVFRYSSPGRAGLISR